jgi:hypothetical protein
VPGTTEGRWDVEFVEGDPVRLAKAATHVPASQAKSWTQEAVLPDGSRYRRWSNLFEFLLPPDARRIEARALEDANLEAFQAYMLVDALSYAMVRMGREPLHATAVLTPQGVVGLLGDSGRGKSTLGALLVEGGCPLLTDDMLVVTPDNEQFLAHPGPPRLKLYQEMADRILPEGYQGVPMNPVTRKLIIPLDAQRSVRQAGPLRALYAISAARRDRRPNPPAIRQLSPGRAFPRVLAATLGHWPYDTARLRNQFEFATRLVNSVPVKTLSYTRSTSEMFSVRDAVLRDLAASTRRS